MNKFFMIPATAALFLLNSCKEKAIDIPDLSVGNRRVLVEEATGVGCTRCPDGARTLTSLQSQFKGEGRELVVVSLHAAGPFSVPYPNSKYDFRSPDAQAIADLIGGLEGFPSSSIDRQLLPGEVSAFVNPHSRWEGIIRNEFAKDYGIDLLVSTEYVEATRQVNITVDMLPENSINTPLKLTVLITEDSIVDRQLDNGTFVENYVHRHVFRDAITAPEGNSLDEAIEANVPLRKTFTATLPEAWVDKHCSVVAFLHYNGTPSKEVIQAAEAHVIE